MDKPLQGSNLSKNAGVYFPSLNGVRFVAALGVIMHHLEQHKYIFGLKNVYRTSFVGGVFGKLGIIMFFVLSGFLITYLLLKEKEKTGRISVKNFYIRRMLRIWPLYYLIVLTGLFIMPYLPFMQVPGRSEFVHDHFGIKVFFMIFFMPNIVDTIFRTTPIPYTDQVWSVGVEEQFYFVWPWLVKYSKNLMKTLMYIITGYFIIKFTLETLNYIYPQNKYFDNENYFWTFFCIDDIALGGIMACVLYYKKEKVLNFLFNKYVQIFTYVSLAIITVKGIAVPHVTYEVYAIFFAVMIINLAANPKTIISFEHKVLNYLGKITYGLYLYHYIAIVIAIKLGMRYINKDNLFMSNLVFYTITFGLCILLAVVSYEFFEKRFLRIKVKFSTIVSGDDAKDEYEAKIAAEEQPAIPLEKVALKA